MKTYLVEFTMDGKLYSAKVEAESFEDARRRLYCMGSGDVLGEHGFTLSYNPFASAWSLIAFAWRCLLKWIRCEDKQS